MFDDHLHWATANDMQPARMGGGIHRLSSTEGTRWVKWQKIRGIGAGEEHSDRKDSKSNDGAAITVSSR
jgi:hypothetical protein